MDELLEIPDAAYTAGAKVYAAKQDLAAAYGAIDAAAPLIVAAYLHHLADIYPGGMSPERLRNEARRLDPQGRIKE
jgi:hypothetical protein